MKNNVFKKIMATVSTAFVILGLCACGTTAGEVAPEVPDVEPEVVDTVEEEPEVDVVVDEEPEVDATVDEEPEEEINVGTGILDASQDEVLSLVNDEGSTIVVTPLENGEVSAEISLYRIGTLENGSGAKMGDGFYVIDAYANEDCKVSCELSNIEGDGYYTLRIVASDWDILPAEESFGNFEVQ